MLPQKNFLRSLLTSSLEPPFDLQIILYTPLTCKLQCPTVCTSLALLLRITTVQTSLVAGTRVCSMRTSADARVSCKYVRKYFASSGARDLSFQFQCCHATSRSANLRLSTVIQSHAAGLANAYVDSQKLDAILREPCSYYGSASVSKMASVAISEHLIFLGEHAPRPPQSYKSDIDVTPLVNCYISVKLLQLVKPLEAIETKLPETTVSQEQFFQTLFPEM